MSGLVWDSSWAIEVPEHELAGPTLHPGKPHDFAGHSSLYNTTQYFESIAARELFEFQVSLFHKVGLLIVIACRHHQNTESQISKDYVRALRNVLDNGVCNIRRADCSSD